MSRIMTSTHSPDNGNDRTRAEQRAIYDVPQANQLTQSLAAIRQRAAELEDWRTRRSDLWPGSLPKR